MVLVEKGRYYRDPLVPGPQKPSDNPDRVWSLPGDLRYVWSRETDVRVGPVSRDGRNSTDHGGVVGI